MTVKLSVSVPDDVGEFLSSQHNASAAVVSAVRAQMDSAASRRQRQRLAARSYAEWARTTGYGKLDELDQASAEASLAGGEW